MSQRSTRLTTAETEACITALESLLAGDVGGLGMDEDEEDRMREAARSASEKLKERRDR